MEINHPRAAKSFSRLQLTCRTIILFLVVQLSTCSLLAQSGITGRLLSDTVFKSAHVGVFVYDPEKKSALVDHDGGRYFIPASNTKLFSLYAGLRFLDDSLLSCRYARENNNLLIAPAGDPTLLHPDFIQQPLLQLMRQPFDSIILCLPQEEISPYGMGWAWDDYDQDYQAENNRMPVFGNCLWLNHEPAAYKKSYPELHTDTLTGMGKENVRIAPAYFANEVSFRKDPVKFRAREMNRFIGDSSGKPALIPFITNGMGTTAKILSALLHKPVACRTRNLNAGIPLRSVRADSLFAPMMQYSDNFFAEQVLLMASDKKLGRMDVRAMIDSLLNQELRDIPDRPEWVDGSGLSRYNLFTPRSMVYLLGKLQDEFGLQRLKKILPTGGSGTLRQYYLPMKDRVYAKTGSVSNHFALSGYLYTKSNRLLYFSVMTGSFPGKLSGARRAVERFVTALAESQ